MPDSFCVCDYEDCHPEQDYTGPAGSDGLCGKCWLTHAVVVL